MSHVPEVRGTHVGCHCIRCVFTYDDMTRCLQCYPTPVECDREVRMRVLGGAAVTGEVQ